MLPHAGSPSMPPIQRRSLGAAAACALLAAGSIHAQQITFPAADGATVHGTWYRTDQPVRAVILAFHQGGASAEAEYGPIVGRLTAAGFEVLAVDLRTGGTFFGGVNRTVEARGGRTGYCEAAPDVAGALATVRAQHPDRRVILWGSSFSGALVLRLAATNPDGVVGVIAFSPATGEPMVGCVGEEVSHLIRVPVLALRPRSEVETGISTDQFAVFERQNHGTFVADPGEHGSSMLVEERVGAPVEDTWRVVLEFLRSVARR